MRFLLCMLLMFGVGLSMAYISADAEQLKDSSFLPTAFDVGDIELDLTGGITSEKAKLENPKTGALLQGYYNRQDMTANPFKVMKTKQVTTSSTYGLVFRNRADTYNKTLQFPNNYLVIYSDLPFEVGWQA